MAKSEISRNRLRAESVEQLGTWATCFGMKSKQNWLGAHQAIDCAEKADSMRSRSAWLMVAPALQKDEDGKS
jgi:hypothetical protein